MAQFVQHARLALNSGQFGKAVGVYRRAISVNSGIAWMYKANIRRIERKAPGVAPPVVLNICSIPDRKESLVRTLNSLLFQVDEANVYLDGYDQLPPGIDFRGVKLRTITATQFPGARDNGKFIPLSDTRDCYFFMADDDIIYPPDYVERLMAQIERYGRMAVLGVHGFVLPAYPARYFCDDRQVFHFAHELPADHLVHGLGTGTIAFHSSLLAGLSIRHFAHPGMTDIYLASFCKKRRIPLVASSRGRGWLKEVRSEARSLYNEFRDSDLRQSEVVTSHVPWGLQAISEVAEHAIRHADKEDVRNAFAALKQPGSAQSRRSTNPAALTSKSLECASPL